MTIKNVFMSGFRNLKSCSLDTNAKQVILTGENGQGKTNLLEAVYLLCYGSSFKTTNLKETIQYSQNSFLLKSDFEDAQGLIRSSEIKFDGVKKTIRLDNKEIKDRKELIYSIPCIVFSHDDIEVVRGEPEFRRRFFDQTMAMYDPVFFDDLRRYKLTLRQRNAAIKASRIELLDVLDEQLVRFGMPLVKARSLVCESFSAIFPDLYENVAQEDRKMSISYRPSWDLDANYIQVLDHLKRQREQDIRMLTTTSGPHRDRFVITDKNGIFTNGASTGQMRLASLIFRSAQASFYRQKTGLDPVFLIDDVLLELDNLKRARYLGCLGSFNQAFFTFLPDEKYFGNNFDFSTEKTKRYNVVQGAFYEKTI